MNGAFTYLIMQNTWREGDWRLYSDFGRIQCRSNLLFGTCVLGFILILSESSRRQLNSPPACSANKTLPFLFMSMGKFSNLYSFYHFHIFWVFRRNVLKLKSGFHTHDVRYSNNNNNNTVLGLVPFPVPLTIYKPSDG
jgi:hypothetical protein